MSEAVTGIVTKDVLLAAVSANLQKIPDQRFTEANWQLFKDLFAGSPKTKPEAQLLLMTGVRAIIEQSQRPVELFRANQRNIDQAASFPIENEGFLHGMPIEYLPNIGLGVLAADFYGGGAENVAPFQVYASQIYSDYLLYGKTLDDVIASSHSRKFGRGKGKVTIIFPKNSSFLNRVKSSVGMAGIPNPNSLSKAIVLGVPATDIRGCIVTDQSDIAAVCNIVQGLPYYVPVYDGRGKIGSNAPHNPR